MAQQNVNFRMSDAGYVDALRALELVSNSFFVPVNQRLALVVRDTSTESGAELGPAMTITIPIPERLSVQDAQEIVTAVQQTIEIPGACRDRRAEAHCVFTRCGEQGEGRAGFVPPAFEDSGARWQVEVDILAVNKSSSLSYGLDLKSSTELTNLSNVFGNSPAAAAGTFAKFAIFGAGRSLMGLGVADSTLIATVSKSSATSVLKSAVVAVDGQPASFHIGDRYPIVTNQYIGATGTGNAQTYAPPPTVTFEDLGLVMKVTPSVHSGGDVSLDISAEYKLLGTVVTNNIPVISNRKFEGKVRLAQGEWGVIAGAGAGEQEQVLYGDCGARADSFIGAFLGGAIRIVISETQLVGILVKPYVMNLPPWEEPHPEFWVGTDSRPLSVF